MPRSSPGALPRAALGGSASRGARIVKTTTGLSSHAYQSGNKVDFKGSYVKAVDRRAAGCDECEKQVEEVSPTE